jgi:hypothetical protein
MEELDCMGSEDWECEESYWKESADDLEEFLRENLAE